MLPGKVSLAFAWKATTQSLQQLEPKIPARGFFWDLGLGLDHLSGTQRPLQFLFKHVWH